MMCCSQPEITNAVFAYMFVPGEAGGGEETLQELDMTRCSQTTITDAAFAHMLSSNARGNGNLMMLTAMQCNQFTVTDQAMRRLKSLRLRTVQIGTMAYMER